MTRQRQRPRTRRRSSSLWVSEGRKRRNRIHVSVCAFITSQWTVLSQTTARGWQGPSSRIPANVRRYHPHAAERIRCADSGIVKVSTLRTVLTSSCSSHHVRGVRSSLTPCWLLAKLTVLPPTVPNTLRLIRGQRTDPIRPCLPTHGHTHTQRSSRASPGHRRAAHR